MKEKQVYLFELDSVRNSEQEIAHGQHDDPERLMEYYVKKEKEGERERIEYLYRYVKLILLISESKTANNPPKGDGQPMKAFIDRIQNNYKSNPCFLFDGCYKEEIEKLLPMALSYIQDAETVISGWACGNSDKEGEENILKRKEKFINDRSNYYKVFRSKTGEDALFLAEAIIDLCYNYRIEDSISHIMKQYREGNEEEFRFDFEQRLCQYWKDFRDGNHVFHNEERTDCIEYKGEKQDWKFVVRFIENNYLETERGWFWRIMKIIMRKKDNAVEETGADILNVQYLGNVVADSGLCG